MFIITEGVFSFNYIR